MRILIALAIGLALTTTAAAHDDDGDNGGDYRGYGYHYYGSPRHSDDRYPDYGRTNPYWERWHRENHTGDGYYPSRAQGSNQGSKGRGR